MRTSSVQSDRSGWGQQMRDETQGSSWFSSNYRLDVTDRRRQIESTFDAETPLMDNGQADQVGMCLAEIAKANAASGIDVSPTDAPAVPAVPA